jgi:uncharacterized protein YqhQ
MRLSGSLSPLFKREGVARGRERLLLIAAILTPLVLAFAPNWLGLTAGIVTTFALLGWLLRGRTLYLTVPVVSVLALALTMELWQLVQSLPRVARIVLLPGLGLQRLTTREPRLDETRVALTALAAVLRRELARG